MCDVSSSRPLVRPRVISEIAREKLLLDDVLEPFLDGDRPGAICICGEPGTGKSAALRHLAGRMPRTTVVEILDEPDPARVSEMSDRMVVIYSATEPADIGHLATFRLAPWGEDECLEYLMAAYPKDCCASVLDRIHWTSEFDLPETPELWTICLDRMAADRRLTCESALKRHLDDRIRGALRTQAQEVSFEKTVLPSLRSFDEVRLYGHSGFLGFLMGHGLSTEDIRLLRNPQVRMLLAVERLVGGHEVAFYTDALERRLPPDMIRKAGSAIAQKSGAIESLRARIRHRPSQSMAASLLHAADPGWKPSDDLQWFKEAYLVKAKWSRIKIENACFVEADLTGADLAASQLNNATFRSACLRGANLQGASLRTVEARNADMTGADVSLAAVDKGDFSGATLRGARFAGAQLPGTRFVGADLSGANFLRANLAQAIFQTRLPEREDTLMTSLQKQGFHEMFLEGREAPTQFDGVDFTAANLQDARLRGADLRNAHVLGARFTCASLNGANLERIEAAGALFDGADLRGATLTWTILPGASFRNANLSHARLADIQWEKADLRDADLREATFHMGSARSGLVFGKPSEGTRNGFYTDEFFEQTFRAPEDVRSANLRGADIRGAFLEDTDFYLVDLRDARYTSDQEQYLRRCGAILEARV